MPDQDALQTLSQLGLSAEQSHQVEEILDAPYGMVLSVGPVGSGKSTTLYACLERLNTSTKSIVTIEDPVERQLSGINQVQVDPRIEFQFADALRGVLRQDPNVMMVGEIRDPDTAQISIRAGLTGVVVLSSMHAGDSTSSIDVFREFGIPGMFLADSLRGIIAQRLVRKLCVHCKQPYEPNASDCDRLGLEPIQLPQTTWFRAGGCDKCFQTGYFGRSGVYEILPITGPIREAILHHVPRTEIRALAQSRGLTTLEHSICQKVTQGLTSAEEMHRVLTAFPHD
jgi:type II secretory ATPase GspE/PulE/Tfp pilus assembly ATPase PilB-like protein